MLRFLAVILLLTCAVSTAQVRILTIGDSITDEYGAISSLDNIFTVGSVYPEPDPPSNNPRAFNWPELLELRRSAEADFGVFGMWTRLWNIFNPGDTRYEGYQYNFALVAMTTEDWVNILNGKTSGFVYPGLFANTGSNLLASLGSVDVAVILLGGNDLKGAYDNIITTPPPNPFLSEVHDRIETIHTRIRTQAPNLPIVVATVPDVGATPDVFNSRTSPDIAAARAAIALINQDIVSTFSTKSKTTVARVDNLTSEILDIKLGLVPGPYDLNGTEFVSDAGDPYNPPDHLFCKDGFHPHTVGQLLIANEVIAAINQIAAADPDFPGTITPFSNREILDILLLDPDQPYLDWIAGFGVTTDGPDDDPDRDGLPNLVEMILGTPPNTFSTPFTGSWPGGVSWTPADERYAALSAEESPDLGDWTPVPEARISINGAQRTVTPPGGEDRYFLRFRAAPRP
ncbi:SGNH/GDSL hydrolase family protein [Haloferula sp. A504]|uniref:SGNH/GDSL hydrolase family protein n=1 Tax=Haloferula sp. A504 TaxID=3373601 RepID=UPI0031C49AD4|nr:SGNH/GDSL hydrolase family protein [Verrucomicrobiaceae bacterium E54]